VGALWWWESSALDLTEETRTMQAAQTTNAPRYLQPGWFTRNVFNRIVVTLTKLGISVRGSRELRVRGRTSGTWRTVPVNPLTFEGRRYLVAPRGTTQWVRNLRVAGSGELRVGRRVEPFRATEIGDDDKVAILREYLRRWKMETGVFFEGVGPDASDEELRAIADRRRGRARRRVITDAAEMPRRAASARPPRPRRWRRRARRARGARDAGCATAW
jgi:hypothetical protein